MSGTLVMYTTPWCGYCVRLKRQLEQAGIRYVDVNVERDPKAEALVSRINGGNRTVPTVVFPDGSCATNPTVALIQERMGVFA